MQISITYSIFNKTMTYNINYNVGTYIDKLEIQENLKTACKYNTYTINANCLKAKLNDK